VQREGKEEQTIMSIEGKKKERKRIQVSPPNKKKKSKDSSQGKGGKEMVGTR